MAVDIKLAVNYIDTEELQSGEEILNKCIDELEKYRLHKGAANLYQHVLNNLGILWSGRREPQKAFEFLQNAESLYKDFKQEIGGAPESLDEYFSPVNENDDMREQERDSKFENTYTHTLYYIAQVYAKLENKELASKYCHMTLKRQLEASTYDPLDWSINAATLSQYFVTVEDFPNARHCLASAELIFAEKLEKESLNESEDMKDKLSQGKADLARCWVKYGLNLLEVSKDKWLESVGQENGDTNENKDEENKDNIFPRFDLELTAIEEQVTDQYLKDFVDAREVFLKIQNWLKEAKDYYVFDGRCSDYIEIVQDHSKAFKYLAFFEMNLERQAKMHKRRIDMISELVGELNSQHYLLVMRQLIYELAETYSTMMDIKMTIAEQSGGSQHALQKVNFLIKQSIDQYEAYLNTLKERGKDELPEEFPDNDLRPGLVAMFCIGRLYSKFITGNVREKLDNMLKTKHYYEFIVNYCEKHTAGAEAVPAELSICKEMVELMPLKMERIRAEAGS